MWIIFPQHIFGHHPFTNIDGVDPDISTAKEVIICYWNYHVLCFGFIVGVLIYGTSSFIRSQNGKINSILTSSRYLFLNCLKGYSVWLQKGSQFRMIIRCVSRKWEFGDGVFLQFWQLTQVLVAQDIIAVAGNGFDLMFSITTDRKNEKLLLFQGVQIEKFGVNFKYA